MNDRPSTTSPSTAQCQCQRMFKGGLRCNGTHEPQLSQAGQTIAYRCASCRQVLPPDDKSILWQTGVMR